MHIDGGCHCGNITYQAEADPDRVAVCHCTDCQVMSGAPYNAVIMVAADGFTLKSGSPKMYVKTAESGNPRAQMFCADCGTRLWATSVDTPADGTPQILNLRLGAVRQRAEITPKIQVWHRSAMPWTTHLADIPAHETLP